MRRRRLQFAGHRVFVLALAGLAGCLERLPMQLEPPAVKPNGIVAYLQATPGTKPNEYVVRAIARRGIALEDPGSFVAAIRWTSPNVAFVADASDGQAIRVVAPDARHVRVAAAAEGGIANGELFALRLTAPNAGQLNELRLEISDLNDRSGASIRAALVVVPTMSWVNPR